jgi:ribose-phosphate pyrophosphokinase
MITLKLTYFNGKVEKEVITPTIFPDGTSQVYKVEAITKDYRNVTEAQIIWQFESEVELMHVAELSDLLDAYTGNPRPIKILNVPFLPYGRQDKPITNTSTFAERTFSKMINAMKFDRVLSFDVHGVTTIDNLQKLSANETIKTIFTDNGYDVYCYPDGGACERYLHEPSVNGLKIRDQKTGKIIDYQLVTEYEDSTGHTHGVNVEGKKVLIVDDILDGGATFIELMKLLKNVKVGEVGLYTSHAIASKGYDHLKEAGISNFYTTNSLIKNIDGINIV